MEYVHLKICNLSLRLCDVVLNIVQMRFESIQLLIQISRWVLVL